MSPNLPYKRIGVAVIWNDSAQILIDKRKLSGSLGGLWEFPGGKIEAGETVVECIAREVREELGIEIAVGEQLIAIDHTYPDFQITLLVHHCQYVSGTPQPIECDEIRWVNVADLDRYQFPAANSAIVAAISAS